MRRSPAPQQVQACGKLANRAYGTSPTRCITHRRRQTATPVTAQIPEILRADGRELELWCTPLDDYFDLAGLDPLFAWDSTGLWRSYVGTWELAGGRLYLVSIKASFRDGREVSLPDLFPGVHDRVFAHWYSGTLVVPQGEMIAYEHGGFGGTYERELWITIVRGAEVRRSTKENAPPDMRGRL